MADEGTHVRSVGQYLEKFWEAAVKEISEQFFPFDARDLEEDRLMFGNAYVKPEWEEVLRITTTRENPEVSVKNTLRTITSRRTGMFLNLRAGFGREAGGQAFSLSLLRILIASVLDPASLQARDEKGQTETIPGLEHHLHAIARMWKRIKAKDRHAQGIIAEEAHGLRVFLSSSEIIDIEELVTFLQDPTKIGEAILDRQYR